VRVLASELGYELVEWTPPAPTLWSELLQQVRACVCVCVCVCVGVGECTTTALGADDTEHRTNAFANWH
jgi:hypothetical protein